MYKPKAKVERRFGINLLVKGERNLGPKAPFRRRPFPPGVHGKKYGKFGKKLTEYGRQFAEKQKLKILYGISERQLKRYFAVADQSAEATDIILLKILEKRLDNVLCRANFADTRHQARQYVVHGHITVNGKRVKEPGYQVKIGDIITISNASKRTTLFKNLALKIKSLTPPDWLELNKDKMEIKVVQEPTVKDLELIIDTPLVIEFYSK